MSRLMVIMVLLVAAVVLAASASGSPGKGQIGGPPTVKPYPPDEGTQTSPALVVGRGRTSMGGSR
jgi:hypothetical protein